MKVIKRDGRAVDFHREKISIAIEKANAEVKGKEKATKEEIEEIIKYIEDLDKKRILVEDIQDIIERKLMEIKKYNLAKKYIVYRYTRALVRKRNTTDESILGIIKNANRGIATKNISKDTVVASMQRDLIAGEVSKDLTKRILLPEKISKAHEEGVLYFHDAEYFLQPIINSCLINIEDMLDNGTVINGKMIESPKSFRVACTVVTRIVAAVASGQYGSQTIEIKPLGKYLRRSYEKFQKQIDECIGSISKDGTKKLLDKMLKQELKSGVQTIYYQLNTLMTSNGHSPYTTIILNVEDDNQYIKENMMIIEEVLNQAYIGMKNEKGEYITPDFPKLIYVLNEDKSDDNNYNKVTQLAEKCLAKVPSLKIITQKEMEKIYKTNGNFNQGIVSINLEQIGKVAEKDEDKFWNLLNERTELCHEALMYRHYALLGTTADISPIHWRYGAISRLEQGERIDKLLKDRYSTLTLGYTGLNELIQLMKEESQDEKEINNFETKVIKFLKNKTLEWKKESGIGFCLSDTSTKKDGDF